LPSIEAFVATMAPNPQVCKIDNLEKRLTT
jgi:hypothetical protein